MNGARLVPALLVALGMPPSTAATPPAAPPAGSSALDAWGAWHDAEGRTYRLAEDGVRTFSCRIDSSLVDLLAGPGGRYVTGQEWHVNGGAYMG